LRTSSACPQIDRGRALYTRPDHLGEYMLVDYLSKKRKKV
jgi:hypothetical protein